VDLWLSVTFKLLSIENGEIDCAEIRSQKDTTLKYNYIVDYLDSKSTHLENRILLDSQNGSHPPENKK